MPRFLPPRRARHLARWRAKFPKAAAACAFLALGFARALSAEPSREEQLRAGYLLNFAKLVEWPVGFPNDDFIVCFVGASGVQSAFAAVIANKHLASHPIAIRALTGAPVENGCQMLYVDAEAPYAQEYARGAVELLTIGGAPNFLRNGGIVQLFTDDNRLRFNINLDHARAAHLKVSSSLLQLASHVEDSSR